MCGTKLMVQAHIPTHCYNVLTKCDPPCTLAQLWCGLGTVGPL